MSIAALQVAVAPLPYAFREQIIGYARAVDSAAPDIAREVSVELTDSVRRKFVFAAGVRRFYAICASSYWTVDNAGALLETMEVGRVRVGRTDYSRGSDMHAGLRRALGDFDRLVERHGLATATKKSLSELLIELANDER